MDVHLLVTLREVRDRGSVTAAAAALRMSPSAVSQQLATLQRSASMPLTRKEGRALVVTAAGEALLAAAQDVFTALAHCEEVLADSGRGAGEPVHVAAFHSAAQAWFPSLVADPALDVRCHDHDVPAREFLALTGDVDVVLAHRAVHERPWADAAVTVVPLLTEPMDVGLRHDHPAVGDLTPESAAGLDWIAVHADYPLAPYLDALALHADRPLRVLHRINEYPTAVAMLTATDCAALLPRHTHPPLGDVTLHPLPGLRLVRHVDALVRPDRLVRPGVRAVLHRLQERARELAAALTGGGFARSRGTLGTDRATVRRLDRMSATVGAPNGR